MSNNKQDNIAARYSAQQTFITGLQNRKNIKLLVIQTLFSQRDGILKVMTDTFLVVLEIILTVSLDSKYLILDNTRLFCRKFPSMR